MYGRLFSYPENQTKNKNKERNKPSPGIRKGKQIASGVRFLEKDMGFFTSAIGVVQKLVVGLGAGLGVWGGINLMEGYGNDNPGAKSQGMKHMMPN